MSGPGPRRYFPYATPYPNQAAAMERIDEALGAGRDVLFEGACGTGKTLAALAPALDHARRTDRTVVITTNVHQQMRQFVAEARAIAAGEDINAVVFRGKASMCHIDVGYEECQVLRDRTRDLVEAERDRAALRRREGQLLDRLRDGDDEAAEARSSVIAELDRLDDDVEALRDGATCDRYRANLVDDGGDFREWLFDGVRTPDEVYAFADEHGYCGYELLKEHLEGVDLAVCNYTHLLDPVIRDQFFRWLSRDPGDVIAVFDEAHNLERAAREHASRSLAERTLAGAIDELRGVEDPRTDPALNVIRTFRDALVGTYEAAIGPGVPVGEEWTDVAVANEDRRDDLTLRFLEAYTGRGIEDDLADAAALADVLEDRYAEAYRSGEAAVRRDSPTGTAASFIGAYLAVGDDPAHHPVVSVRRAGDGITGRVERFACFPRVVTRPLFEALHASVLMSATLRPFRVTADVLGLQDPVTAAFGLSFPTENRRTLAVDTPPLFASARDDPGVQATVTGVVEDAIRFTPGNTLVFFPNYAEAERYAGRVDRDVLLDRPGVRAEETRREFVAADDAALFTSLWGTLTEGVSFDGADARTVAVVGVPYPHLDDRLEAVQAAYDDAFDDPDAGWSYGVEIPTVRKTRQALGRALRGPDEVGVRLLVDRRYTAGAGRYGVRSVFPDDERDELVDVDPGKVKYAMLNFYGEHGAWPGAKPTP